MMAGALRRYSAQREYDLARASFDAAREQFEMAQQASQGEVERRCEVSAAKYMSDGFSHLSLAESLLQE
jgi:hypothetical protein